MAYTVSVYSLVNKFGEFQSAGSRSQLPIPPISGVRRDRFVACYIYSGRIILMAGADLPVV